MLKRRCRLGLVNCASCALPISHAPCCVLYVSGHMLCLKCSVSGSGCSAAQFAELDNKPSLTNSHYIRSLDYGISFEDPQLNQVGVYLFWSLCLSLSHTLLIVTQMTGTGTNSCVYPLPCPLRLFKTLKQQTCLALLFHINNLAGSVTVVVVSPHLSFSTSEPAYLFCNYLIIICLFSP